MKKVVLFAAVFLASGAVMGPAMAWGNKEGKKEWMGQLTTAQKNCLESHGCPKFTKEEKETKSEAEWAAKRGCKRQAFEACGIPIPEKYMKE
ncbi:MAG: hypothetical protein FWE50_04835 [Alphaproteobacteria bacterium]|nr:hypothetical protein [Alphaproteobacteria bacterium]